MIHQSLTPLGVSPSLESGCGPSSLRAVNPVSKQQCDTEHDSSVVVSSCINSCSVLPFSLTFLSCVWVLMSYTLIGENYLFSLSKLLYIFTVILIMHFVRISLLNLSYNPVSCCDKPLCALFLWSATTTAVAQFSACKRTFIMSSVALNGAFLHRH